MACIAVHTGDAFLAGALAHIDCQAQAIGAYGFSALASPGSPVSLAANSLLTIFIALFGIRVMLGHPMDRRDIIGDVLKLGIMLTLATSWPAWRVVGYDLVIQGPTQIARAIGLGAGLPGGGGDLAARLQNIDRGLAAFNTIGSGRLGVAQGDWFQLGFARSAFLTGTLGPLALVRLTTGFLLAVTPLMAGLLLFGVTRSIFEGWVRALVTVFLASIMLTVVYGVELAMLEPWLLDALQRRATEQQTLDAPVEILVATLSFAVVALLSIFFVARLAFHASSSFTAVPAGRSEQAEAREGRSSAGPAQHHAEPSRGMVVVQSVSDNLRREERLANISRTEGRWADRGGGAPATLAAQTATQSNNEALGNTWRRQSRRPSAAARRRDQT
jgi:type IV secretion system protein VirB6